MVVIVLVALSQSECTFHSKTVLIGQGLGYLVCHAIIFKNIDLNGQVQFQKLFQYVIVCQIKNKKKEKKRSPNMPSTSISTSFTPFAVPTPNLPGLM